MNDLSHEPLIGVLHHWTMHNLHKALAVLKRQNQQPLGTLPYMVTGEMLEDSAGTTVLGQAVHTSFVMDFDLASRRIKTLDGVYELAGPGFFSYVTPQATAQTVDDTRLALAYFENKQLRWALGDEWIASLYGSSLSPS